MKRTIFLIISLLSSNCLYVQAQQDPYDFLTIVIENKTGTIDQVVYYPEGSTYEVKDENGKEVKPLSTSPNAYTFEGNLTLFVTPEYRKEKMDNFSIQQQKLKIFTTAAAAYAGGFGAEWNGETTSDFPPANKVKWKEQPSDATEVSISKELMKSTINEGKYNMKLTFSNGIIFTYQDGAYAATLGEEELEIQGKYIIRSRLGTAKLSFNTTTGKVWWVFEPKKEE